MTGCAITSKYTKHCVCYNIRSELTPCRLCITILQMLSPLDAQCINEAALNCNRKWSSSPYVLSMHALIYILVGHVQSASQETCYSFSSFARKNSRQNTPSTELPTSMKHTRTISNPKCCSFVAVPW